MKTLKKLVAAAFCLGAAALGDRSAQADPLDCGYLINACGDGGGTAYPLGEGCQYGPDKNLCVMCCDVGGTQCYYCT